MKAWLDLAAKPGGDDWATDKLLSRPDLSADDAPYYEAFLDLDRDRRWESVALGMAGGLRIPERIPRRTITAEGRRLGFEGNDLEDFVAILISVDDHYCKVKSERIASDQQKTLDRLKKRR